MNLYHFELYEIADLQNGNFNHVHVYRSLQLAFLSKGETKSMSLTYANQPTALFIILNGQPRLPNT